MSYELHLESIDEPLLDFDRWEAAVRSTHGVRPVRAPGGEESCEGVEMQFDDEWIPVFSWRSGVVTFQLGDYPIEVLTTALELARKIDARVRGDEGEEYASIEDLPGSRFG